jgi:hypothetical protein
MIINVSRHDKFNDLIFSMRVLLCCVELISPAQKLDCQLTSVHIFHSNNIILRAVETLHRNLQLSVKRPHSEITQAMKNSR